MVNINKVTRFNRLDAQGRIDLSSGAWNYDHNVRRAHCGRCGAVIEVHEGKAYNEFMRDGYRATTRYICSFCCNGLNRDLHPELLQQTS